MTTETPAPITELHEGFSQPGAEARPWSDVVEVLTTSEMFWLSTVRRDGRPHVTPLPAIGAIKELDETHGELKSMHTVAPARGRGVGRAVLERLVGLACERGYRRVSLETGSMEGFRPARSLYERFGFEHCEAFGDYAPSPHSTFMTLRLAAPPR